MKPGRVLLLFLLILSGCSELVYDPDRPPERFLQDRSVAAPESAEQFSVCQHYGCAGRSQVRLSKSQWQQISNLFSPAATTAAAERTQIAAAIGMFETFVGTQNNTFADQACNASQRPVQSFQLDCVAETINTTVYLLLLEGQQLLRWYRVGQPTDRGWSLHYTAVIRQIEPDLLYAVDSWFRPNGQPADIVPLPAWRDGDDPAPCP